MYADADGDGYGDADAPSFGCGETPGYSFTPGDCDDSDPSQHPGAVEDCLDGVDNDCNGEQADCSPWDADAILVADVAEDTAGASLASGDFNGDGLGDLVIGAPYSDRMGSLSGAVHVFFGPISGQHSMSEADVILDSPSAGDVTGYSVASAGDVDGNGVEDLLVGAPYDDEGTAASGATYLILGPLEGDLNLALADESMGWPPTTKEERWRPAMRWPS